MGERSYRPERIGGGHAYTERVRDQAAAGADEGAGSPEPGETGSGGLRVTFEGRRGPKSYGNGTGVTLGKWCARLCHGTGAVLRLRNNRELSRLCGLGPKKSGGTVLAQTNRTL